MSSRIAVAKYVGDQDFGPHYGHKLQLYNILIPIRTIEKNHYHPVGSTLTPQTINKLVPGMVFPTNTKIGDIAYSVT